MLIFIIGFYQKQDKQHETFTKVGLSARALYSRCCTSFKHVRRMHEHLIIILESSAEWHKNIFMVLFIVFLVDHMPPWPFPARFYKCTAALHSVPNLEETAFASRLHSIKAPLLSVGPPGAGRGFSSTE